MAPCYRSIRRRTIGATMWNNSVIIALLIILSKTTRNELYCSVCGAQTYALIRSLVSTDKSFKDIVDALTKHFSPPPSSIVQRYRFNTRVRAANESVADYVAALRQLTEFCEVEDTVDKMLRDRLVCGINDDRIQRRLLAEPTLDFAKALQISLAMESAAKDSKHLSGGKSPQQVYYGSIVQRPQNHLKNLG